MVRTTTTKKNHTSKHTRAFFIRTVWAGGLAFLVRRDTGDAVGKEAEEGLIFRPRDLWEGAKCLFLRGET